MSRKVLVIGLGQFGRSLALALARRGVDVTVLDRDEERVGEVAELVDRALAGDASDRRVLEELGLEGYEVVVNAIGDEYVEDSLLCTAVLAELGARRVIARATSDVHGRILAALGVSEIVSPESYLGERLAVRIAQPAVKEQFDLGENVQGIDLEIPESWVGRTLRDLDLRRRYKVTVVALRRPRPEGGIELVASPSPEEPLRRGEIALIVGSTRAIDAFLREVG